MLFRKPMREPISDSDEATGAHRLVGARPVEHGCGSYFCSAKEKSNRSWVKGACPHQAASPLEERGGHSRNFHASSKKPGRYFYRVNYSMVSVLKEKRELWVMG